MGGAMGVWSFRHMAEALMRAVRRNGYSYDAAFRRYEESAGLDPRIRRKAYLAGRDFISRYFTLVHVADRVGLGRGARSLADLWIYYFGNGFLDEDERKRYSKKIARRAPRGRLPDMDELLDGLDEVTRMSAELSYPRWLVAELRSAMGDEAAEMLRSLNEEHRWLRVNLSATDVESAISALSAEGVDVERHDRLQYMLRVRNYGGPLSRLKAVRAGYVTPQDLGSAIVAEELDDDEGVILDACSAPGGKAAVILMRRRGMVVGCDVSTKRLLEEAALLRRWRMPEYRFALAVCDATRIRNRRFDQSLLDAPCTDSGDVGRNPAVKLMLENRGVVERFARLQSALLRSVRGSTRGVVVYSTCSVLPEEGERIVWDVERLESRLGLPAGYWGVGNRVYPHLHDAGGFFVSRLAPNAESP
ncbi:MAG: RsmB/NOP family class I SAM-dependent RNA methyltransferase [Conexivisphaera sp.]